MPRTLVLGTETTQDASGEWVRGGPVELDADALVRHAFVCGASGAGKTVFSKGLVEEAVLAGVPVIAVDFKGDLASLALAGPRATPDALRTVFGDDGPAVAAEYLSGASDHGVDAGRAAAYGERAHVRLFTPNSSLGRRVALSALPSFPEQPRTALEREERDELIQALVLGFAHAMYGTPAAVKKNEPAVKVVEELVRWCADHGEPLDGAAGIARVLDLVTNPPVDALGGMSLDAYLPARDKQRLMQKLNSRLLGAERTRYEGRLLSVETMLGGVPEGKTPLSILYLGHVSDFAEQASVLGQLCADVYRWMRRMGGSSGLRLLIYIDELGGGDAKQAFYPSAPHNPPSKAPLNLLVRQGRSAGIGMLLATQNPASVDVRGLGNINTWSIGRLTRKNDHSRIEDLLSRLPGGPQDGAKVVSQLPKGVLLALSDALDGPRYVAERWLYSVHRQLSPAAVGAIHALLPPEEEPTPVPTPPAPVAARPAPAPAQPAAKPKASPKPATVRVRAASTDDDDDDHDLDDQDLDADLDDHELDADADTDLGEDAPRRHLPPPTRLEVPPPALRPARAAPSAAAPATATAPVPASASAPASAPASEAEPEPSTAELAASVVTEDPYDYDDLYGDEPPTPPPPAKGRSRAKAAKAPKAPKAAKAPKATKAAKAAKPPPDADDDAERTTEPEEAPPRDGVQAPRRVRSSRSRTSEPKPARHAAPMPTAMVEVEDEDTGALLADTGSVRAPVRGTPVRGGRLAPEPEPTEATEAVPTGTAQTRIDTTRRLSRTATVAVPESDPDSDGGRTVRFPTRHADPEGATDVVPTRGMPAQPTSTSASRRPPARADDEAMLVDDADAAPAIAPKPRRSRSKAKSVAPKSTRSAAVKVPAAPPPSPPPAAQPGPTPLAPVPLTTLTLGKSAAEQDTITLSRADRGPSLAAWVLRFGRHTWPVPTDRKLTIGRSPEADVQIYDGHVSRMHAELTVDGETLVVRRLQAKNETLVDGAPIDGEIRIPPRARPAEIVLGSAELIVACVGGRPRP